MFKSFYLLKVVKDKANPAYVLWNGENSHCNADTPRTGYGTENVACVLMFVNS